MNESNGREGGDGKAMQQENTFFIRLQILWSNFRGKRTTAGNEQNTADSPQTEDQEHHESIHRQRNISLLTHCEAHGSEKPSQLRQNTFRLSFNEPRKRGGRTRIGKAKKSKRFPPLKGRSKEQMKMCRPKKLKGFLKL
jgi:hypothetical protein